MKKSADYPVGANSVPFENQSEIFSWSVIPVLDFLKGRPWDDAALAFVSALRPSALRISTGEITCSALTWRVYVEDDKKTIKNIEQEVRVNIPDEIQDGHSLRQAVGLR